MNGIGLFGERASWEFGNITCVVGENATGKTVLTGLVRSLFAGEPFRDRVIEYLAGMGAGPYEVLGEFTFRASTFPLAYRRKLSLNRERNKVNITSWSNEVPFSGTTEAAVGHSCIAFGTHDWDSTDALVYRLHDQLTGNADVARCDKWDRIGQVVERHGDRLASPLGRLVIRRGKLYLRRSDDEVPVSELGSVGMRFNALCQLVCIVAFELAAVRPTVLVLDDPFGHMDVRLASDLSERLWTLAGPNMQLIVTTTDSGLPGVLRADTVIRLSRHRSEPVMFVSKQQPRHALVLLQEAIESYGPGKEDPFIDEVLRPALLAMGCSGVSRVRTHGPGERGIDLGPFAVAGPFGRRVMAGVQAKAGNLHSKSGKRVQSVEALVDEVRKALDFKFVDKEINHLRRLDYVIAAVSGGMSDPAKDRFYGAFDGDHRVILWESSDLAELLWHYHIRIPRYGE